MSFGKTRGALDVSFQNSSNPYPGSSVILSCGLCNRREQEREMRNLKSRCHVQWQQIFCLTSSRFCLSTDRNGQIECMHI
jgi:hypothetical protein